MTGVLIRREKCGHGDTRVDLLKAMRVEIAVTQPSGPSQRTLRILGTREKLAEARKDSLLEPSEGACLGQHLGFRLPDSRIVKEYISVVLSHPVLGTSVRQNTPASSFFQDRNFLAVLFY